MPAAAGVEDPGAERGVHRVRAEAEPEELDVGRVTDPVAGAPARPHAGRRVQRHRGGGVHPRAPDHRDVGDRQVRCGQAAHHRAVAVADQRDLTAVPGEVAGERPERGRALPGVARRQHARAERGRCGVAEPGDDREVRAGVQLAGLLREGRGRAAGRSRAAGVERGQGGIGTGHDNGHARGLGQVADDLDGQALPAGVEVDEVVAAQGVERAGQALVACARGRARVLGDHAGVFRVARGQGLGGERGERLRPVDRDGGEGGGRGRDHRGGGGRPDGDLAAESHGRRPFCPARCAAGQEATDAPLSSASPCGAHCRRAPRVPEGRPGRRGRPAAVVHPLLRYDRADRPLGSRNACETALR